MALQFMDNFIQYGLDESQMLDGIYADMSGTLTRDDPAGAGGGPCWYQGNGMRRVLSSSQTTVGIAGRYWFDDLPDSNDKTTLMQFRDAGNDAQISISLQSTGAIAVHRGTTSSGTNIGSTAGPVMTAGAWSHVEAKVLFSQTVGTVEVRVNGVPVLTLTNQDTCNTTNVECSQVFIGNGVVGHGLFYFKDFIVWDGSGSVNNDFVGDCQVVTLLPQSDDSLGGWDTSEGSTGWDLIRDDVPGDRLLLTGSIIPDDDRVWMNSVYYKWTTGSVDAGTPAGTSANPWLVNYGGSDVQALANLKDAINATGVAGTTYSTALTQNTAVKAVGVVEDSVEIVARDGVDPDIITGEDGAGLTWQDDTMPLGATDNSFIAADSTPPAASTFNMTNLDAEVVTVKGLMTFCRAYKTDGGTANLQVSLVSGASTDNGADRPVTTTPTTWMDISELDPATAAAWTPIAVNAVKLKIDRTV